MTPSNYTTYSEKILSFTSIRTYATISNRLLNQLLSNSNFCPHLVKLPTEERQTHEQMQPP